MSPHFYTQPPFHASLLFLLEPCSAQICHYCSKHRQQSIPAFTTISHRAYGNKCFQAPSPLLEAHAGLGAATGVEPTEENCSHCFFFVFCLRVIF